jgi:peptide/nickel transport system permease protein
MYGTRISMSVGLVGVSISLVLGLILGGVSGYYGGHVDKTIQRLVEFLRSMPTIPLWMGLAAAIPLEWPPLYVYLIITALLSLIGWTSLAREVRGKVMALKGEDFVVAARLDGVKESRIITRQILPSFASHIIAVTTLAIPEMILAETALSFLGIGLQPPVVSWGVLLREAQNINTVATAPWLLWPGLAVVVAVLSFNFLGDGLRDAADPYATI